MRSTSPSPPASGRASSSGRPATVPSSNKPILENFDGRILQAQAHLFEPEKQLAVGAGRDYEAEMRQLEARADALTAEAERIDLTMALRECTNNVARATEVARGCAASNGERALAKIRDQQERFRAMAAAQGIDLEQDRATLGLEPSSHGRRATAEPTASNKYSQPVAPGTAASGERMAALRARATTRAEA